MSSIDDAVLAAMAALDSKNSSEPDAEPVEQLDDTEVSADADLDAEESEESDESEELEDTDTESSEELDDQDDEESDDSAGEDGPIELDEDTVVSIDGKTGTVRDLMQLKADYTRKTQELANQRAQVEEREQKVQEVVSELTEYFETRNADPSSWVAEIVTAAQDPTAVFALALKTLADRGALDPRFIEHFGLTAPDNPVLARGAVKAQEDRVAKLEAELQARKEAEALERQQRELMASFEQELADIVEEEGLSFSTSAEQRDFNNEVIQFALDHDLVDLRVAYAALAGEKAKRDRAEQRKLAQQRAAAEKKRKAQVMAKRPAVAVEPPQPQKTGDLDAAIAAALAKKTR